MKTETKIKQKVCDQEAGSKLPMYLHYIRIGSVYDRLVVSHPYYTRVMVKYNHFTKIPN